MSCVVVQFTITTKGLNVADKKTELKIARVDTSMSLAEFFESRKDQNHDGGINVIRAGSNINNMSVLERDPFWTMPLSDLLLVLPNCVSTISAAFECESSAPRALTALPIGAPTNHQSKATYVPASQFSSRLGMVTDDQVASHEVPKYSDWRSQQIKNDGT